ncbi:mannose-6-phosphate isomerase, class I [Brachybacterium massiliense]|uniref:mannose-6-phosphate isomerase, class I n=1 Tax=Brachybacterium massiliense TaxID=1755098 RepID=UPI000B3BAF00|nr:mannose-6-phosphate isomerase, class I [Brachybacterium massiliense]
MQALEGQIQHYLWGSQSAIPEFLGRTPDGSPWAEAWYGAHPVAPSLLADGRRLDDVITADPATMLGEGVLRAFSDRLPYLLKVIAPAKPLSLQVHPKREHAAESFAAEEAAGLAIDSPLRSYRDDNHKPEMVIALTRFTAVCGFRTPRRAATLLEGLGADLTDRLHALLARNPTAHGMRAAFRALVATSMRPSAEKVAEVVAACAARLERGESPSPRIDRTIARMAEHFPGDPGVVAVLLLNPVTLQPGEAMYVPAGALHAYIDGVGLEIMAASDNVLRAGLTPKRVDAEEMLQCVDVVAAPPVRIAPERLTSSTVAYFAPVDDFELMETVLPAESAEGLVSIPGAGPRIVLALEGEVTLFTAETEVLLRRGEAVFVSAAEGALSARGEGRFVQACVP